jgi:putative ribosome biogenesis GTPase RsgA
MYDSDELFVFYFITQWIERFYMTMESGPSADKAMEDLQIAKALKNIQHKILVFSGKGGVGKSTISACSISIFTVPAFPN